MLNLESNSSHALCNFLKFLPQVVSSCGFPKMAVFGVKEPTVRVFRHPTLVRSTASFPLDRPNQRLKEDLFTVVTPLSPEGETLDVLAPFSVFRCRNSFI